MVGRGGGGGSAVKDLGSLSDRTKLSCLLREKRCWLCCSGWACASVLVGSQGSSTVFQTTPNSVAQTGNVSHSWSAGQGPQLSNGWTWDSEGCTSLCASSYRTHAEGPRASTTWSNRASGAQNCHMNFCLHPIDQSESHDQAHQGKQPGGEVDSAPEGREPRGKYWLNNIQS